MPADSVALEILVERFRFKGSLNYCLSALTAFKDFRSPELVEKEPSSYYIADGFGVEIGTPAIVTMVAVQPVFGVIIAWILEDYSMRAVFFTHILWEFRTVPILLCRHEIIFNCNLIIL